MEQPIYVALITGASRGLGREVAHLFARRGAGLILTARGAEELSATADELRGLAPIVAVPGDVAQPAHAAELVRRGLAAFGRIDVLVNNASTLGHSPLPDLASYPVDDLVKVFEVNTIAPLRLIQFVLPAMRQRGRGVIINVTSDAAVEAYPGWGGYGASKAALEHLSRVLAEELRGSGIRVYVVDPGDMNTRMHREAEPGIDLSDLPGPDRPAPAFIRLVEDETAEFGRYQAESLLAAGALGRSS